MGKQKDMKINGTFGDVIYYFSRGQWLTRSKPKVVKRNRHSIQASQVFGMASAITRLFKTELMPALPVLPGQQLQHRFEGVLRNWLRSESYSSPTPVDNLSYITGMECNPGCEVLPRLHMSWSIEQTGDELVQLYVPSFVPVDSIPAAPTTTSIHWRVAATSIHLPSLTATTPVPLECKMDYNDQPTQAQVFPMQVNLQPGNISFMVLQLTFLRLKATAQTGTAVLWSGWGGKSNS